MNWKKLGQKVAGIGFPLIGKALAGSAGAEAGKWIAEKFGASPDAGPAEIASLIERDPQAFVKLTEIQLAHEADLAHVELDREKAYLDDRASARARQIAGWNAEIKEYMPSVLALIAIIGFMALCGLVFTTVVPDAMHDLALIIFGALVAIVKDIYAYFFGSSAGSARKTDMLVERQAARE